jgi:hypothetical protein
MLQGADYVVEPFALGGGGALQGGGEEVCEGFAEGGFGEEL